MKGRVLYRPGPNSEPRTIDTDHGERYRTLSNVRWRGEDGRVHQASKHHNRTLCEMGSNDFTELFHVPVVEPTCDRVDCVECIRYVTWPEYPID